MYLMSTENKKFVAIVSEAIQQLVLNKLSLTDFGAGPKKNIHSNQKRLWKYFSFLQLTYLCEAGLSTYTLTKTSYHSTLIAEADMRIQVFPIMPNLMKKNCKNTK